MQNTFESNVHYWLSHSIWYLFYCDTNTSHHNLLKKLNIAKVCNHITAIYFEQIIVLNITNTRMSIFIQCMYENCMERKQNKTTNHTHTQVPCFSLMHFASHKTSKAKMLYSPVTAWKKRGRVEFLSHSLRMGRSLMNQTETNI